MKTFKPTLTPSIQIALRFLAPAMAFCSSAALAVTVSVPLQQPTATFSQTLFGDFSVARAINGTTADDLGWSIFPQVGNPIAQTAAFETVNNVGFAGGSLLTFTLTQNHSNFGHLLGRFRLSVTTDDRSLFCDGLATGGDVTANWTVLSPSSVTALNTTSFTVLGDQSILAGGTNPDTDVYTVTAQTFLTGITGIRLEAIEDPSLPFNGPGRWPGNGNFVLSEFEVGIAPIPEPATSTLLAFLALGCLASRRLTRARTPGTRLKSHWPVMKRLFAVVISASAFSLASHAQILLSGGLSYSQNFNSLPSAGTSGTWIDNSATLLRGWYASKGPPTNVSQTIFRIDAGGDTTGGLYDYGSVGSTDRALGSLVSNTSGTNAIGLLFKNDTGAAITGDINVSYTGEQWRNGGNLVDQTILSFGYRVTSTDISGAVLSYDGNDPAYTGWFPLSFTAPRVGSSPAALDGNASANRLAISGTLSSITLNPGDEIMLRWYDINDVGNDHGGGIDDLTVTFGPVPEPAAPVISCLGLVVLALRRRWSS